MLKKQFFVLIYIFIISCSNYVPQVPAIEKSSIGIKFEKYRNGIIHIGQIIKTEQQTSTVRWFGTGFSVDKNCTFATAKHIFRNVDRDQIVIRFQKPPQRLRVITRKASILYEDNQTDIAFLKIDRVDNKPCTSGEMYSFPLSTIEYLKSLAGESIMIIGHPLIAKDHIDNPVLRIGTISSTEITWDSMSMILLDLIGVPGFSGSPIILIRTGEAIGVVFGPGPTRRASGFEWATPITLDHYNEAINQLDSSEY